MVYIAVLDYSTGRVLKIKADIANGDELVEEYLTKEYKLKPSAREYMTSSRPIKTIKHNYEN